MNMVSIIVPVYNTEQYLVRCLDSILTQTFSDFELILVDDGSTDSSGIICDEYAAKDPRVRVFHKKNGGVSSARNLGLDNANGKYVGFVDSDDFLLPDMYQVLFDIINSADGIGIGIVNYTNSNLKEEDRLSILDVDGIWDIAFKNKNFYIVDKLFVNDLIGTLRFNESIKIGEDLVFITEYLKRVKKGAYRNAKLYHIDRSTASATRQIKKEMQVEKLPGTMLLVLKNTKEACPNKVETTLMWIMHDFSLWYQKLRPYKKIFWAFFHKAFPIRMRALFARNVYWKTRIAFFIGKS